MDGLTPFDLALLTEGADEFRVQQGREAFCVALARMWRCVRSLIDGDMAEYLTSFLEASLAGDRAFGPGLQAEAECWAGLLAWISDGAMPS